MAESRPCASCGYGGKHLEAPPCCTCPAYPKGAEKIEPLTLDELLQMNGQPVWVEEFMEWAIVRVDSSGIFKGLPFVYGIRCSHDANRHNLHCYRYKPSEDVNVRNVKCKNCANYRNEWCEKIVDSPNPDVARECAHFKQLTNHDCLRDMSDYELAIFLAGVENRRSAAGGGAEWNGAAHALKWLREPVKEEPRNG